MKSGASEQLASMRHERRKTRRKLERRTRPGQKDVVDQKTWQAWNDEVKEMYGYLRGLDYGIASLESAVRFP